MDAEESRLASRSFRKVCKSVLSVDVLLEVLVVLLVLLDEVLPEAALSAETRLLKSDFSVLRALSLEEVEDVDELLEPPPNCEISCSTALVKFE